MKTLHSHFGHMKAVITVLGWGLFCVVFLFSSCDNFLKGSKTREDLERNIEYANADEYQIKVNAQKGSGIVTKPAAGEAKVKVSDTFNLSFSSESDSQFLKWEAYNAVTNAPLADDTYLQIENPLMIDTTCTFVKDPEDENIQLAVRAVTAKRPRIILSTPTYQETGAPRSSNVQIFFDKFNMETNIIYYTQEEMEELKKKEKLTDEDFLQGDSQKCGGQYYGYIKDDVKHFKNIQIASSCVDGSSLTKYYFDPYWEKEPNYVGGRTLVIQVTNPPPPKDVSISITLAKDFCYFEDDIAVTLREDSTINYKTNVEKEDVKPAIIVPKDEQGNYNYNVMKFKDSNGDFITLPVQVNELDPKPENIPACNDVEYITMSFNFTATDEGGSGMANRFRLCVNNGAGVIELPYLDTTASEAYTQWSKEYLIPRSAHLQSAGEYNFTLEVIDNDGNGTTLGKDNNPSYFFWLNLTKSVPNY